MKKLFALALALSAVSGLYGLTLGLGGAYENLAGPEGTDPYLAIKMDARVPVMPILDIRAGLLHVELPEGGKEINFGTFVDSDLLIKIPMAAPVQPYIVAGVWFNMSLEEDGPKSLGLKAGLGIEMPFGGLNGYLEGGLDKFTWYDVAGTSDTQNPLYVQVGVTYPLNLGM